MPKLFEGLNTAFSRKKVYADLTLSPLNRVLGLFSLTALGVGSTLGVGVYVLAGQVAKEVAGPGVVLSFVIAAVASMFSAVCFAEFGSRVPRAGSAYVYSYVSIGEFIAFIIGWDLVLEYCIGAASVMQGFSLYIDKLMNNTMSTFFRGLFPMNVSFLGPYPDFFAFAIIMVFTLALAFGMRESTMVNNTFTAINVSVITFVIIYGLFYVNTDNWGLDVKNLPPEKNAGTGGFLPFGYAGVISGAATCFYAFVGFDSIATAGEEVKNPHRTIPLAILIALTIISSAYVALSSVMTLMWPYYDQDPKAPLTNVFSDLKLMVAYWIVTIGAIFALMASLFGAMFPLPRIVYAMSSDGLLFAFLGKINPIFKTPVWGTLLSGLLTATLSCFLNLKQLIDMMSIGTLMAYSIVAVCVTHLRFKDLPDPPTEESLAAPAPAADPAAVPAEKCDFKTVLGQLINREKHANTTPLSECVSMWALIGFCVLSVVALCVPVFCLDAIAAGDAGTICGFLLLTCPVIGCAVIVSLQPRSRNKLVFSVPWVPLIPCISVFINFYLMMSMDYATWIRFGIWLFVGFAIYFGYGIRHSKASPEYQYNLRIGRKKETNEIVT